MYTLQSWAASYRWDRHPTRSYPESLFEACHTRPVPEGLKCDPNRLSALIPKVHNCGGDEHFCQSTVCEPGTDLVSTQKCLIFINQT